MNTAPGLILFITLNQPDMNKHLILKSDILDIVFEKRNKMYGAYDLRKFYQHRLKLALTLMFITAAIFSGFTLMPEKKAVNIHRPHPDDITTKQVEMPKEPEKKQDIAKPKMKEAAKPTNNNQHKYLSNIVMVPKDKKADSIAVLKPEDVIGTKDIVHADPGPVLVTPVKADPAPEGGGKHIPVIDKSVPMDGDAVDVLPSFPGGMDAFRNFMQKNLQTPEEMESGTSVTVKIKFVVDYNGKLKGFSTVQDGGDAYNKEVMRVLRKMPDWIPGKAKGENVAVYHIIPVKFVPQD